jgi:subfamily B ATP-binding cassette protein MsbA
MRFFGDRSSGEIISRQTNDVAAGTKALNYLFEDLAVQPFLAAAYAGMAFYFSWQLAIVFIVLLVGLALPVARIARRVKKYGRQKLERIAILTSVMSEIYHGIRVIKAFGIQKEKRSEFAESNRRYISRLFKTIKLKGRNRAITEGFVNICIAGVMFFASYLVTTGVFGIRLSPPDVMAFGGCMFMLYRPIKGFARVLPNFMQSVAASERVFEVLDLPPEQEPEDAVELPPIRRSIAFRNVSFAYDGPLVLEDISFEVPRGAVVAVVGHSGAGKSTLLDLIPRFYDPLSGRIEIDGVDIRRATLHSLRRQIAVVSQEPFLFRTTIAQNIRYGRPDATDDQVVDAAKAANIHEFIEELPRGYETLCGERGVNLSGGQRQRITIARAVLKDAPILILDEATSSLDAESQRLVHDALQRLMEHRTTFVIAHRLSTVQHADTIVVLREGHLVEVGTHEELIRAQGEYWQLYKTEFESAGILE